ncbi:glutathione S-transferase family protein [Sphingobium fluviale]|uniref:glutathione S-transferase family protein n=1 Tax=Sphingobium fluviale TaxID=2506423 RepID=UPI001C700B15|nr:glutathione S-transferase family protein [Sphingobium fluviale]
MKIYFGPGSVALAGLIALEEANAEFEPVRVVLAEGEQRKPEFLALNKRGQVPVLIADGQVIAENIAVLTYIANRFPDAKLLPLGDPAKLARAYELLSWFATNVHIAIAQIARSERFSDNADVQAGLKESGKVRLKGVLAEFDRAASGTWLLGEDFSVVDPLAFVAWRWAERFEIDLTPHRAWAALVDRIKARPSFVRATAIESGLVTRAA